MKLKKNIKIASFDLDDTLLYRGELSERNRDALINLHNCGVKVVINTGRGLRFIPESCQKEYVDYLLASNGSILYDNQKKEKAKITTIPFQDVKYIYSLIKKQHAVKLMTDGITYTSLDLYPYYISMLLQGKMKYGTKLSSFVRFLKNFTPIKNLAHFVQENHDIFKMECSCKKKTDIDAIVESINKNTDAFAVKVRTTDIEICSKKAGKGQTLLDLADQLGIEREAIAAFGDSGNDIDALKVAGYAIAMDNSEEEIKKIANIIIGQAKDDAIGRYIESIIEK